MTFSSKKLKSGILTLITLAAVAENSLADLKIYLTNTPEIEHSYVEIGTGGPTDIRININKDSAFNLYLKSDLSPNSYTFGNSPKDFRIGPGLDNLRRKGFNSEYTNSFGYSRITYAPSPQPSSASIKLSAFSYNSKLIANVPDKNLFATSYPGYEADLIFNVGAIQSSKPDDFPRNGCVLRSHTVKDAVAENSTQLIAGPRNFVAAQTTDFTEKLSWTPVAKAKAYHVQIFDKDTMGPESLIDEFVVPTTCVNINDLDGGYSYLGSNYYWALVTAIGNFNTATPDLEETVAAQVSFKQTGSSSAQSNSSR